MTRAGRLSRSEVAKLPVGSIPEQTLAAQLEQAGIPFEREFMFAYGRRWRFDFAISDLRIGIEIEGGTWVQGRHSRGAGYEADLEKYNAATIMGWAVLRFTPSMVDDGRALDYIQRLVGLKRVWLLTDRRSGCWLYMGTINGARGYGTTRHDGRVISTHRLVWTLVNGPIPEGLDIDHTCHNTDESCPGGDGCQHRRCVNPAHLEAVTRSENVRRGRQGGRGARMTDCKRKHGVARVLGVWRTRSFTYCPECQRENRRAYQDRQRALKVSAA